VGVMPVGVGVVVSVDLIELEIELGNSHIEHKHQAYPAALLSLHLLHLFPLAHFQHLLLPQS
jgi:hypothetical protein